MSNKNRIEVYPDAAGEWRWRLRAANGETVADSSEGYTRVDDAKRAAYTAINLMDVAVVVTLEETPGND